MNHLLPEEIEMTNRQKLEAKLTSMSDADLQAAIDGYTLQAQYHTENERPILAENDASKALLAQAIKDQRHATTPRGWDHVTA